MVAGVICLLDANLIEGCGGKSSKEYLRHWNFLKEWGRTETDLKLLKNKTPENFTNFYDFILVECRFKEASLLDMKPIQYFFINPKLPVANIIEILVK